MTGKIKGAVYVATNSAMPGLVKIGRTTAGGVKRRLKELQSTGVPCPFKLEYSVVCTTEGHAMMLELAVHRELGRWRYNEKREFFRVPVERAYETLSSVHLATDPSRWRQARCDAPRDA